LNEYSVNLNSKAAMYERTGELDKSMSLSVCTDGIQALSIIVQVINGKSYNGEDLLLCVSNDNQDWILLKSMTLGRKSSVNYSVFQNNDIFGSSLHFRFCRVSVPAILGVKSKIIISVR
jgi:hypothetical protein